MTDRAWDAIGSRRPAMISADECAQMAGFATMAELREQDPELFAALQAEALITAHLN